MLHSGPDAPYTTSWFGQELGKLKAMIYPSHAQSNACNWPWKVLRQHQIPTRHFTCTTDKTLAGYVKQPTSRLHMATYDRSKACSQCSTWPKRLVKT
jgi:hypothetical protein